MAPIKKAIITGISGQDGTYLAKLLIKKKYEVIGIGTHFPNEYVLTNLGVKLKKIDIRNGKKLTKLITDYLPNEFYNFAGKSSVAQSWNYKECFMEINGLPVETILNKIKNIESQNGHKIKFYQASSSEIFAPSGSRIKDENSKIGPVSPYGASKAYAHFITNIYRESYKMYAASGILFNHESPLRSSAYLTKKITSGIVDIKNGKREKLLIGDLNSCRDWGYAGDYVKAIWLMMQLQQAENFVISSGKLHSVGELIEYVFSLAKVKNWNNYLEVDTKLFRPSKPNELIGDSTKAEKLLGWKAKKSIFDVLKIMYFEELNWQKHKN